MPHLAWPLIPQLQHRTVRYGSVCSGIEAASVPVMRWIGLRMHLALTTPSVLEPHP